MARLQFTYDEARFQPKFNIPDQKSEIKEKDESISVKEHRSKGQTLVKCLKCLKLKVSKVKNATGAL
jgi:hypothetical protein